VCVCKFQLCHRGKIQSRVEDNFQNCQLRIRRFLPTSPYSSLEKPLCTAAHFIIQLNRTLFEILPNKSRRNEFEICRSKQIHFFSLSLSVSQGPFSRLLSIFHSIKRMKRQGPIAEDLCVGAEAPSFNMLTSKPSAPLA